MWPRARALVAVVFVALVGALIVLRDQGYLGGRLGGGPLRIGAAAVGAAGQPNQIQAFGLSGTLKGGPVRVQNVRPRIVSPELEILGPNVSSRRLGIERLDAWPPNYASDPLKDAGLRGAEPQAVMGLRAQRRGVYYAIGLITDYRRGQRRYRDREAQILCVAISRRQRCDLGYRGPRGARVAQVGGPARYPAARLDASAATFTKPGKRRVRITLANQTRSVIDVSDLAFDRNDAGVAITRTQPETFRLPPRGHQVVRLEVTVPPGCDGTFPRLRADLDDARRSIPLSLPLRFACG